MLQVSPGTGEESSEVQQSDEELKLLKKRLEERQRIEEIQKK